MFDLLIRGGRVFANDDTLAPMDLGVRDGRVAALGTLADAEAAEVIDARNLVIAPGLIDVHNHSDGYLLRERHQSWKTGQGFTTEILMSDGISYAPVDESTWREWFFYLRGLNGLRMDEYQGWRTVDDYLQLLDGAGQNSAALIPYANVRSLVCGFGRDRPDDLQRVQIQYEIRRAMEQGAVGLSSGLDYIVQCWADTDELIAACRAMAPFDGVYVTHMRYKLGLLEAIREAFQIAREAGVRLHISHLKTLAGLPHEQVFELLDREGRDVDYRFDVYPYQPGSTMLNYLLPYEVWEQGPLAAAARLARPEMQSRLRRILESFRLPLDRLRIAWAPGRDQPLAGVTLGEYVGQSNAEPADAISRLLIEHRFAPLLVFLEGDDRLIEPFLAHDKFMLGSDGIYFAEGCVHPRVYGSAPRLLGPMVRDRRLFSLEDALRKASSRSAEWFRLEDRGVLRIGAAADVLIFDPETIIDRATYDQPHQLPLGVEHVLVNGQPVVREGQPLPAQQTVSGQSLRRRTN